MSEQQVEADEIAAGLHSFLARLRVSAHMGASESRARERIITG